MFYILNIKFHGANTICEKDLRETQIERNWLQVANGKLQDMMELEYKLSWPPSERTNFAPSFFFIIYLNKLIFVYIVNKLLKWFISLKNIS